MDFKNSIQKVKKKHGFIGIETAIIGALIVVFAIATYNYLLPTFVDIAISIRNAASNTY